MNQRRSNALWALCIVIISGLVITCFGLLIDIVLNQISEDTNWIFVKVFLGIFLVITLLALIFGTDLLLMITHARRTNKLDHPQFYKRVQKFSQQLGIKEPHIFIIPEFSINCCSGGLTSYNYFIGITRGFIKDLEANEQEALVAHEIAHLHRGDNYVSTISAVFLAAIVMTHSYLLNNFLMLTKYKSISNAGILKVLFVFSKAILSSFLLIIILGFAPIFNKAIKLFIDTESDKKADLLACQLVGNKTSILSAMDKISHCSEGLIYTNSAIDHLFFMNTDMEERDQENKGLRFFATRPDLESRKAYISRYA